MNFTTEIISYDKTSFLQAALLDYEIINITPLKDPVFVWLGHGNLSLAGFEVELKRHISRYVMHNHMTSGLFVCVSWISFVVPTEAIPGRMALLITLLLVLVNIFNSATDNQPHSDTITAASGTKYSFQIIGYSYENLILCNLIFSLDSFLHIPCFLGTCCLCSLTLRQVLVR